MQDLILKKTSCGAKADPAAVPGLCARRNYKSSNRRQRQWGGEVTGGRIHGSGTRTKLRSDRSEGLFALTWRARAQQSRLPGSSHFCPRTQSLRAAVGGVGERTSPLPQALPDRDQLLSLLLPSTETATRLSWGPLHSSPPPPEACAGHPCPSVMPSPLNSCSAFTVHRISHLSLCLSS